MMSFLFLIVDTVEQNNIISWYEKIKKIFQLEQYSQALLYSL